MQKTYLFLMLIMSFLRLFAGEEVESIQFLKTNKKYKNIPDLDRLNKDENDLLLVLNKCQNEINFEGLRSSLPDTIEMNMKVADSLINSLAHTSLDDFFIKQAVRYQAEMHAKKRRCVCLTRFFCGSLSFLEAGIAREYFIGAESKVIENIDRIHEMRPFAESGPAFMQLFLYLQKEDPELKIKDIFDPS